MAMQMGFRNRARLDRDGEPLGVEGGFGQMMRMMQAQQAQQAQPAQPVQPVQPVQLEAMPAAPAVQQQATAAPAVSPVGSPAAPQLSPAEISALVDPRSSPYFAPQESGDGMTSLGSGNGLGWLDWSRVPGFGGLADQMAAAQNSVSGASAGNLLTDALSSGGYRLHEVGHGDNWVTRGVVDAENNFVGDPQRFQVDDDQAFGNAALLAAAVTTGNVMLANSALAAGGSAAGGAGAAAGGAAGGTAGGAAGTTAGSTSLPGLAGGGFMDATAVSGGFGGGSGLTAAGTMPTTASVAAGGLPGAFAVPALGVGGLGSTAAAAPGLMDSLGPVASWVGRNGGAVSTVVGGLLGGLSGGGGGGGSAPVYGPPKAWNSGLTMGGGQSSAPRQRAPVIDYTLPSTGGLSMGAGRFLGRGG